KVFDAGDFVSAVLQPQYRAGYLELNSRFGEPIPDRRTEDPIPIPTARIYVSYRFLLTETNDRVIVDYNTAELMEIVLTIKNFPQSALPLAQTVTVKGSTEVRNFFR
ncbi:MAG: hypothetical protein IIC73_00695, partial [Armatimonadetes bacterium]|nr:hypothetical protein [Armatimonadota bacterium]